MKFFIALIALGFSLNAEITLPSNFKTDFKQTITNDKGKIIKYEGDVFFVSQKETNSLFKWSYTVPTQKEVCTDGRELIVVDHDLEQVSTYLIDDGINLEEILKVAKQISTTTYQATYKEVEYLITLDEKQQLKQIVYVDNLDNKVKIIFTNMNYDITIDFTKLNCSSPEAYDIIKG